MGKKRRVRIQRNSFGQCRGKRVYSLEDARGTARSARRHKDKRLHPYYCRECGGWHLTSGKEAS